MNRHTHAPPSAPARPVRTVGRPPLRRVAAAATLLCCATGQGIAAVHGASRPPGSPPDPVPDAAVTMAGVAVASVATAAAVADALSGAVPSTPGRNGAPVLHDPDAVRSFYGARSHRPAWTTGTGVRALRAAIDDAAADGLDAARLGPPAGVADPFPPVDGERARAIREIGLTDLLLRLRRQLRHGTTAPGAVSALPDGPAGTLPDTAAGASPDGTVELARSSASLDAGDVARAISDARPDTPLYAGLRDALIRHVHEVGAGGLPPPVGDGPTIEPGSGGERVARLRRRFDALDALDDPRGRHGGGRSPRDRPAGDARDFDPVLGARVRAFQERHGLEVDGKVGSHTLAAVDTTLDGRIERLRVNLERARHIALALGEEDRIVVNVADQHLTLELDGETTWESDVVVGRTRHRTPVHIDRIRYLELDPTWTVPRRIVMDTLYERARRDPAAFANEGFVLRDLGGTWRDPRELDWATMTPERFHYDVVQRPGPRNPLGRVKFIFPNRYAVYLHDTPNRALFDEDVRTFSRGCVRVRDADTLAALLLEHRNGVHRPDIVTLRAAADQVRIDLERPLLVALLYWTAEVDAQGRLRLIEDVYGRDAAAARELEGATS